MTGVELMQERLVEEGFSVPKIATNKDFIFAIIKILSESDETLHKAVEEAINFMRETQAEAEAARQKALSEESIYESKRFLLSVKEAEYDKAKAIKAEAEELKAQLLQAETPEARDMIRRFYIFKSSCAINTVYDNTAFISGAGAILGGKKEEVSE